MRFLSKMFALRVFMPRFLLILCAAVGINALLPSCLKRQAPDTGVFLGESVVAVGQNDAEILRIADEARGSLSVFFRHLTRAGAGEGDFSVKYPFAVDAGSGADTEQMWLTRIRFRNGQYYGTLASTPVYISGMKKGDRVNFIADNITDWMYVKNGKIIGGQSVKCLLERTPEDRRNEAQNKLLQMFED
jgi:uncharacterized protein YegJ (DUF2314 family)